MGSWVLPRTKSIVEALQEQHLTFKVDIEAPLFGRNTPGTTLHIYMHGYTQVTHSIGTTRSIVGHTVQ